MLWHDWERNYCCCLNTNNFWNHENKMSLLCLLFWLLLLILWYIKSFHLKLTIKVSLRAVFVFGCRSVWSCLGQLWIRHQIIFAIVEEMESAEWTLLLIPTSNHETKSFCCKYKGGLCGQPCPPQWPGDRELGSWWSEQVKHFWQQSQALTISENDALWNFATLPQRSQSFLSVCSTDPVLVLPSPLVVGSTLEQFEHVVRIYTAWSNKYQGKKNLCCSFNAFNIF